ncbi:protein conserved in bacteria [Beggiatoa sp. PS]|nr:protein conserved in bacteria [Beggiatoa sp. PS]
MADAFTLQLNADFINLSGCNTGIGEMVKGEGIMGLTRAFMYAGTSAISVTLWAVDSLSAKMLSIGIFENLKAGKKVAEALRQTKIKMIEGKMNQAYHHPFYWAPFVVYGN